MKKKLSWGLAFIFSYGLLLSACADIDRNNILDPKNASSGRDGLAVAELFTTTGPGVPGAFNAYALSALDSLRKDFGSRFIAFVYHRNSAQYTDPDAVSLVEPYYEDYTTNYRADRFKGVPDLFINGPALRVQGASSAHSVIARAQSMVGDVLLSKGLFTIETEIAVDGQIISGQARIAPLGNKKSGELRLRILLTRDDGPLQKVLILALPINMKEIDKGGFIQQDFSIDTRGTAVQSIYFLLRDRNTQGLLYVRGVKL